MRLASLEGTYFMNILYSNTHCSSLIMSTARSRLVNAKQNYSETTGSVWLTNRRGVWIESAGRAPDYGNAAVQLDRGEDGATDMFQKSI